MPIGVLPVEIGSPCPTAKRRCQRRGDIHLDVRRLEDGDQAIAEDFSHIPAGAANDVQILGEVGLDDPVHVTGREVLTQSRAALDIHEQHRDLTFGLIRKPDVARSFNQGESRRGDKLVQDPVDLAQDVTFLDPYRLIWHYSPSDIN